MPEYNKKLPKKELLHELNSLEKIFTKYYNENKNSKEYGITIMLGVLLGILGNFLVTIFWDLGLKQLNWEIKILISLFLIGIFWFLIIMAKKDHKRGKSLEKELERKLDQIENDKDKTIRDKDFSLTERELFEKYTK